MFSVLVHIQNTTVSMLSTETLSRLKAQEICTTDTVGSAEKQVRIAGLNWNCTTAPKSPPHPPCSIRCVTCGVPGGARSQAVSLQQNYVGHAHFSQLVDGVTAQTASSDHHHIRWSEAGSRPPQVSWEHGVQSGIRAMPHKTQTSYINLG